ncbi:hypothetical protein ACUXV3_08820 [Roseobacteraceae bacterium NS-SX3]
MTPPGSQNRGGGAVGVLSALPPLEAGAVIYLRHWFAGPEPRAWKREDFAAVLGPQSAAAACGSFGRLCAFCAEHGRRPLMHHGLSCTCLGADESCFAHLVASAAEGQDEDALLLAALLVPPQKAQALAELARDTGRLLQGLAAAPATAGAAAGAPTLH